MVVLLYQLQSIQTSPKLNSLSRRTSLPSRTQRSPLEGNLTAPEGSTTCPSPRVEMDPKGRSEPEFPCDYYYPPRYSLLKFNL